MDQSTIRSARRVRVPASAPATLAQIIFSLRALWLLLLVHARTTQMLSIPSQRELSLARPCLPLPFQMVDFPGFAILVCFSCVRDCQSCPRELLPRPFTSCSSPLSALYNIFSDEVFTTLELDYSTSTLPKAPPFPHGRPLRALLVCVRRQHDAVPARDDS